MMSASLGEADVSRNPLRVEVNLTENEADLDLLQAEETEQNTGWLFSLSSKELSVWNNLPGETVGTK